MQWSESEITLRPLSLADIPLGMQLKELAHWNQLEKDWDFLIRSGLGGNFVATYYGKEVGTLTTLYAPVAEPKAWCCCRCCPKEGHRQG